MDPTMAVQVLAIAATVGESAEFTLTADTLVWVHGSAGNDVLLALDIKGSDGKFSSLSDMSANGSNRSGVLPAGDYRITRLRGVCGFQRAA
jgi:hypothetical protein